MSTSKTIKKIFENFGENFFSKNKPTILNKYEILENDPKDVIFAKNLNNSGGRFFYSDKEDEIKNILKKLITHLKIDEIYCIDEKIKKKFSDINISLEPNSSQKNNGIILTCEHLIADQGKVLLSSSQIKNKKIDNFPGEIIVIAYISQIVLRINDAMRSITKKYKTNSPFNISTIGSGKKKLSVIVVEDFEY
ncbi:MAG: hypothetical protein CMP68_04660 [Flavobacteriales bacterium]|nr:hypothetical protein [Flavobacteriales bacterium]|tara:strand:+ start:24351 stop:24929 length:579 start_codon:yes stop_codon:yes gene_type:complete